MSDKNKNTVNRGRNRLGVDTILTHGGYDPQDHYGFVNPPITRGSTVLFPDAATMRNRNQPYSYGTRGTPLNTVLENITNELEGAEGTILVPSGLAAVTVPLLGFLSAGDHALFVDTIYTPTRHFADTMLKRMGVDAEYFAPDIGADIIDLIRPNTKVIFLEAPASNTFEMQDVPAITALAQERGIITMLDNTYATPLYFRPLEHGVDISIHAATKYPSGHADVLYGMVSANAKHWPALLEAHGTIGACANPEDTYLIIRGMRTMGIRLRHHEKSALDIAQWLETQEGVGAVMHPALKSHVGHEIWKRDFEGSSGIFSFVLKDAGQEHADAFLDALQFFGLGYSWAGYESLAVHVNLRDRTVSKKDYGGQIIRLQIGLEDIEDLRADIANGLRAANAL